MLSIVPFPLSSLLPPPPAVKLASSCSCVIFAADAPNSNRSPLSNQRSSSSHVTGPSPLPRALLPHGACARGFCGPRFHFPSHHRDLSTTLLLRAVPLPDRKVNARALSSAFPVACLALSYGVLMAAGAGSGSGAGATGTVSAASLWSEVNRCGQNGDYGRALKSVNKSE